MATIFQKLDETERTILQSLLHQKIREWSDDLPDDDAVEAVDELIALKDKITNNVLYISAPDPEAK